MDSIFGLKKEYLECSFQHNTALQLRKQRLRTARIEWLRSLLLEEASESEQSVVTNSTTHEERKKPKKKRNKKQKPPARFQTYERLLEMPHDLTQEWMVGPLPAGTRAMLVTRYSQRFERVVAFLVDEAGKRSRLFSSYLGILGEFEGEAILEGVYVEGMNRFYILDLIFWKEWFVEYPFEVRQFILSSKLAHLDAVLKDKSIAVSFQAGENELLLRHVLFQDISKNSLSSLMNSQDFSSFESQEEEVKNLVNAEKDWLKQQVDLDEAVLPDPSEAALDQRLISLIRKDASQGCYLLRGVLMVWKGALHSSDSEIYEIRDLKCSSLPDTSRISKNGYLSAVLICNQQYCLKTQDNKKVFKGSKLESEEWGLQLFRRYRVQFTSLDPSSLKLEGVKKIERATNRPCHTSSQILAAVEAQKEGGVIGLEHILETVLQEEEEKRSESPDLENQFMS